MIAEFARYYQVPDPDMSWGLFLALVQRTGRFEARTQLSLYDAVSGAIGAAFGGGNGRSDAARDRMLEAAYPVRARTRQVIIPKSSGSSDG